ncbi:hypothetical protein [Flavivirga aquatica]|uniref:hypothetical protein n=1 Tax=Flavivirga aquatica TaxID=1849968 RepID=UPI0013F4CB3D|nr:hypothetical protein [Flavivirga aquatica]
MKNLIIPLVNWGIGTIFIGVFALVCVVLALVVYNMANSDKKNNDSNDLDI